MTWLRITEIENVPFREGRSITVGDREIAIFNVGTGFVAMENRCPHKGGPLADGILSATGETLTVTCPLHNWRVAVESGQVVKPAGEDGTCVRTFAVKVTNGIIEVCVDAAGFNGPRRIGIAEETVA